MMVAVPIPKWAIDSAITELRTLRPRGRERFTHIHTSAPRPGVSYSADGGEVRGRTPPPSDDLSTMGVG
jgi:hypothetical protein